VSILTHSFHVVHPHTAHRIKAKENAMETEEPELLELLETDKPAQAPPATLAEYLTWPEEPPYYEFINGIATLMPAPTLQHQYTSKKLFRALEDCVEGRNLGTAWYAPVDVHLSDEQYFQPDIVFVSNERNSILGKRINGAPDLVVEILSPSNGYKDVTVKKFIYEEFGVREYWIVDPATRSVEVLTNSGAGGIGFQITSKARTQGTVRSAILDGFSVEIQTLFA
jgi:Uma2 family endonuclease